MRNRSGSSTQTRLRRLALCTALLAALPGAAQAVEVDYVVGVSLLHSDNLNLGENNEISESVLSPNFRFQAEETGSTIQLKATGDLQYLDYLGNKFGDEARGQLSGQFNWTVLPDRVNFVMEDYLSRQPISVLNAFSPTNQQQINVFVAGPSFYARLGDVTRAQFDLRYSNSYAEESKDFNGDRYNAAIRLVRELSARDRLSLTVEATQADFDASTSGLAATDYKRYDAYLGFTRRLKDIDLGVDVGYSRLDVDQTGDSQSAPLVRGNAEWKATARSTFSADLSYQFADAAEDLVTRAGNLQGAIISDLSTADVLVGPSVFRQRRLELGYQFSGERFTFQLHPQYQRIRYEDALVPDQQSRGGYVELGYKVLPRTTMSFLFAQDTREFDDLSRRDRDQTLNLGLKHEFTRHWFARLDLQHRRRDSSIALQSYDENAVIVAFSYQR
jgi:Putative beta-barrel porin 2